MPFRLVFEARFRWFLKCVPVILKVEVRPSCFKRACSCFEMVSSSFGLHARCFEVLSSCFEDRASYFEEHFTFLFSSVWQYFLQYFRLL